MNHRFRKCLSLILLLAALQVSGATEAAAAAAPYSFDSVWFLRNGTRVVPEISRRWLTVVFNQSSLPKADEFAPDDSGGDFIRGKAGTMVKANPRLVEYLYDPNITGDACFLRMREGLNLVEIRELINQLGRDRSIRYVLPTLVLENRTFAFFNAFDMEWKTGTRAGERESLLNASHAVPDEESGKENRYLVDLAAIPYFKALNLLAEDIRVLRVTPHLVEVKPSIRAGLSLFMNGGNVGDSIHFSVTIDFSDRVVIDPSSISTINLRPPELQKELFDCTFDPYDYARAATRSPIVITGRMRFYTPGEFTVPPVKISYSCPSCPNSETAGNVRFVETVPVLFKVSSMVPADQTENRLMVPNDSVPPDFGLENLHRRSLRYLWLAIISFAGIIPCAAWMLLLRHRTSKERDMIRERKRNAELAKQLRAMLQAAPDPPHWRYLAEVGGLLREYLTGFHGIDPKYRGGSGTQFMETVRPHLPAESIDLLSGIMAEIDDAVALELEHYQGIERLQGDILKFLDMTDTNRGPRR